MGYQMVQVATNTGSKISMDAVSSLAQVFKAQIARDGISSNNTLLTQRVINESFPLFQFWSRITDVDVKKDSHGDNRVVIVTFNDGTIEKAVTSDNDTFNLEQGIQICLAKKAFSILTDNGSGSFNKLVNNAVKLYNNKVAAFEKTKEETLKQEARAKKRAEKKAKWLDRKKAKEREARVNEMAEAYAKAIKMVNEESEN